jgi:uncharacterized protein (DUF1810 family)
MAQRFNFWDGVEIDARSRTSTVSGEQATPSSMTLMLQDHDTFHFCRTFFLFFGGILDERIVDKRDGINLAER